MLAVLRVAAELRLVVLPVLLAIVLATFLTPPVRWLREHGWHDGIAALAVLLFAVVVLFATFALMAPPTIEQFSQFDVGITEVIDRFQQWIRESPLPISSDQVNDALESLQEQLRSGIGTVANEVVSGALLAVEVLTGLVLSVVILFFLLKDGRRIWDWVVSLMPPQHRDDVRAMGDGAWSALGGFVRGQTIVALFDAVLIGLALVVLDVPLALPLAVLIFFGAFVPVIGATVTGALAALVALASAGLVTALLVVGAIIIVQQLEGNILEPVVVGRAVHVHPVAILIGVTIGAVLAGIIGAMVAAPLVAMGGAVLGYLREVSSDPDDDAPGGREPGTGADRQDAGDADAGDGDADGAVGGSDGRVHGDARPARDDAATGARAVDPPTG